MPRYHVSATVIGSQYVGEFEAASPEAAIEKAQKIAHVSFCHECANQCENAQIENISAEEIVEEGDEEDETA